MVKRDQGFPTVKNNGKNSQLTGESNVKKKRRRRRKPRLTGLSKERQTANARERSRMRSISDALLHLRYHLPSTLVPKDQKLSKIQTLRLAIGYISDLWKVVQNSNGRGHDHVLEETISGKKPEDLEEMANSEAILAASNTSTDSTEDLSEIECVYCDVAYFAD